MPLLDHSSLRDSPVTWASFHSTWTIKIVDSLNLGRLPEPYRAMPTLHVGIKAEIDVATVKPIGPEKSSNGTYRNGTPSGSGGGGGIATATAAVPYAPPKAILSAPVDFAETEGFELLIHKQRWGLVAAIELVSPANKDRPESRTSFTAKCASYLAAGVSLVVVDAVAERAANLHAELCDMLRLGPAFHWHSSSDLSANCYRSLRSRGSETLLNTDGHVRLDVWPHELFVGRELPTVPLWLAADLAVPLELERTYAESCRSLRLDG